MLRVVGDDQRSGTRNLYEFTKSEALRKHALAVEACVVAYARRFQEDESVWSVTALLHDFDYEMHPDAPDHPMKGEPILAARGVSEEIRRAILSHANYSGVARTSLLEKTLFACDELAGFLTAVSYVKPAKSIHEVEPGSVKRKLKDKGFARSVSRDDIRNGAQELGVDLDEHIGFCIAAMQARAAELGLRRRSAGVKLIAAIGCWRQRMSFTSAAWNCSGKGKPRRPLPSFRKPLASLRETRRSGKFWESCTPRRRITNVRASPSRKLARWRLRSKTPVISMAGTCTR